MRIVSRERGRVYEGRNWFLHPGFPGTLRFVELRQQEHLLYYVIYGGLSILGLGRCPPKVESVEGVAGVERALREKKYR